MLLSQQVVDEIIHIIERPDLADLECKFGISLTLPTMDGGGIPMTAAAAMRLVFIGLQWLWVFVHKPKLEPVDLSTFDHHRDNLIGVFSALEWIQNVSAHYVFWHMMEDVHTWGPLYWLLEEGPEASHQYAHRMGINSTRGRHVVTEKNSWEILCRRTAAAASLTATGAASQWVLSVPISSHAVDHVSLLAMDN